MAIARKLKSRQKILVIEDHEEVSGLLRNILMEEGYEVEVCADGNLALDLVKTFLPDLILLDLQVPNKNGREVLQEVRKRDQEYGNFIPVIVLTGVYTSREDKVNSLDAGADDFLPKPFDVVELLARVRSLLKVRDLYKRSQYLATHDHLTRCYNRRFLLDFLERELRRYERYKSPFTYMLIDLDHFKTINDEHGHEVGDEVLVHVGFALQDFFRGMDCVARLGGDEFSVVLPDTDQTQAEKVGLRLMEMIKKTNPLQTLPAEVAEKEGYSVGSATLPINATDIENLMHVADEAMYQSKKAGRNRFTPSQEKAQ